MSDYRNRIDAIAQEFRRMQEQLAYEVEQGFLRAMDRLHIEALERKNRRLSWEARLLQEQLATLRAPQHAVYVEGNLIHASPSEMIVGLGYPFVYQDRAWWMVNVDGNLLRLYRGPKI